MEEWHQETVGLWWNWCNGFHCVPGRLLKAFEGFCIIEDQPSVPPLTLPILPSTPEGLSLEHLIS